MSSLPVSRPDEAKKALPPLENGDQLDQKTFHARYEAMPSRVQAELIGGIVYMGSPLKRPHGRYDKEVILWLGRYQAYTPGTEVLANTTAILDEDSEPQPDSMLIVMPEYGGQMKEDDDEYLCGSPELIAETASSSVSIDLHRKKHDYEEAGVQEYIVVNVRDSRIHWFIRRGERFEEMQPGADGIYRSEVFPGLWLDPAALLLRDTLRVEEVLQQGLATPEHKAFVAKLQAAKK